jgi:anaerobic selenocysteine-containing dehydrogenase
MTPQTIYEAPRIPARPGEEIVRSTCGHNCGGRCVVNAHVQAGRIVRISTDPRKWTPEMSPLTACVRGFGALERVYHPSGSCIRCGGRAREARINGSGSRGRMRSTR